VVRGDQTEFLTNKQVLWDFFLDIESGAVVWKSVTGEVEDNVSGIAERIVTLCGV